MSFRQVIISDAIKVGIKNGNINVVKSDKEVVIPIEDVFIIVVEDTKTLLSAQFISKCAEHKISVVICNAQHDPYAICHGYNTHYRQLYILNLQINLGEECKAYLWQQIVRTKIQNQFDVVKLTSNIAHDLELLGDYKNNVKLDDITQREGIAAKVFFKSLYGNEFIRFYDDQINASLNFGYKILASAIARELVSLGIDPKIGIWHESRSNSINLAYDLIEIFRPLIDYFTFEHKELLINEFSIKLRRELVNILNIRMELGGKMQTVQNCINYVVKSYLNILEGKSTELVVPKICKVEFYINE